MPLNQTRLILDTPPEAQPRLATPYAILIASDDEPLVAAITTSLRTNGFEVCRGTPSEDTNSREDISSGLGPCDCLGTDDYESPSLIVLDTELSPERRSSVLHTCRANPSTPIVALAPRAKVRQSANESGVWLCLAKPVDLSTLLTAITQIARHTAAA